MIPTDRPGTLASSGSTRLERTRAATELPPREGGRPPWACATGQDVRAARRQRRAGSGEPPRPRRVGLSPPLPRSPRPGADAALRPGASAAGARVRSGGCRDGSTVPSMFSRGSSRSSHAGIRQVRCADEVQHRGQQQAADDERVEEHGAGEAQAELLDDAVFAEHEREEHAHHDRRGGGHHAPGQRQALGDRARVFAGVRPALVDARDQEHLVVHRQAEHDREQHHRDERLDRPLLDAEQAAQPAPLEDRDDHAERGADAEQVHHGGLQRDHERAEDDHQQQRARAARRRR